MRRTHVGVVAGLLVALCAIAAARVSSRRAESIDEGERLLSKGAYAPAAWALARVVALSPGNARAHYYLGLAYAGLGQEAASRGHLEEAVRLSPSDARYHHALGDAYRKEGDRTRALAQFEEAVRRDSNNARYEVELAGLLLDERRWAEAVAHLRRMARSEPRAPEIRILLADALRRSGDFRNMESEYREAMRLAGTTALGELARQELRAAVASAGLAH